MTNLAYVSKPNLVAPVRLVRASQFTIDELTRAYNQTRVDYLVPMPMNAARLSAYLKIYDIDMERSWVAIDEDEILGLAMLGVRTNRTWITRLGVLPVRRRVGTGEALTRKLLEETRDLGCSEAVLEVIKGNQPAHALFKKVGFREIRELLILRRPPGLPQGEAEGRADWLENDEIFDLLSNHSVPPAWTNEIASFHNGGDAQGIEVNLNSGGRGWLVFRRQKFLLSHFIFHTMSGDPDEVASALISHLYDRYSNIDTYVENIPADDPHFSILLRMGFMEVFRRVEMEWTG